MWVRRRLWPRLPASPALRASLAPRLSSAVGLTRHPAVGGLKWASCPFVHWPAAALSGLLNGSRCHNRRRVLPKRSKGREMLCLSPVREPPQKWAGPGDEWTGRPFEAARYTDVSEADPRGSRFLRAVPQGPVQRDSSAVAPVPSTVDGAREARRAGEAGSLSFTRCRVCVIESTRRRHGALARVIIGALP